MPLAPVHIGPGRSAEGKQRPIDNTARAIAASLGAARQSERIIVNEVKRDGWGVDGKPIGSRPARAT